MNRKKTQDNPTYIHNIENVHNIENIHNIENDAKQLIDLL